MYTLYLIAYVVGSNPTLPKYVFFSIYAIKEIGEVYVKTCIADLIGFLKAKYEGKWFNMNIVVICMALCVVSCEIIWEVSSVVEHSDKVH